MSIMTRIADVDHALIALDGHLARRDYTAECRRRIADHVRAAGTLEGASPRYLDPEDVEPAEAVFCEALPPVPECSADWDIEGHWTPNDTFRIVPPELDPPHAESTAFDPLPSLARSWDPDDAPDPTPDDHITRRPGYWEAMERDGIMPLLAGGSPDESDDKSDDDAGECRPTEPDSMPDPAPDEETVLDPQTGEEFPRSLFELPPISGGSSEADHAELFEPTEADRRDYAAWSEMLDRTRDWYNRNGDDPDRPMGRGLIRA